MFAWAGPRQRRSSECSLAVIGLQSFWIARSLDALRSEMHRGFDRLDARIDRVEARSTGSSGREPPSLRQRLMS